MSLNHNLTFSFEIQKKKYTESTEKQKKVFHCLFFMSLPNSYDILNEMYAFWCTFTYSHLPIFFVSAKTMLFEFCLCLCLCLCLLLRTERRSNEADNDEATTSYVLVYCSYIFFLFTCSRSVSSRNKIKMAVHTTNDSRILHQYIRIHTKKNR